MVRKVRHMAMAERGVNLPDSIPSDPVVRFGDEEGGSNTRSSGRLRDRGCKMP